MCKSKLAIPLLALALLVGCGSITGVRLDETESAAESAQQTIAGLEDGSTTRHSESLQQPENRALMKADTFTIHEDVPEIHVEAHGDLEEERITLIRIYNTGTGTLLREVDLLEYTMSGSKASVYKVKAIDMDFDGYLDLQVLLEYQGIGRHVGCVFLLWDNQAKTFVESTQLYKVIGPPIFDAEQKQIHTYERDTYLFNIKRTYEYIDGEIELVELELMYWVLDKDLRVLREIEWVPDSFVLAQITTKRREPSTGEMIVVGVKYQFLDDETYEAFLEYDVQSERGAVIQEIVEE